jgi:hypothetical protein
MTSHEACISTSEKGLITVSSRLPDDFKRSISGIVDVLIDEVRPQTGVTDRDMIKDYVAQTVAGMPDFFRMGFRLLAIMFEYSSIFRYGRSFSALSEERQRLCVKAWREARLSVKRSMIGFYATFTAFGIYSVAAHS